MLGTGGAILAIAGCMVMFCIVIVGVTLVSPAAVRPPPALKALAAAASPAGSPAVLLSKDVPLSPEAAIASELAPVAAYGLNK